MKNEFKNEENLRRALDSYTVKVPKDRLLMKQSTYDRFITYLFSPANNPFERVISSKHVFTSFKIMPLFIAIIFSIIQTVYFFTKI